ncbi:MAG: response regulator [Bacteroidales bacterium]|nr:response regulator [Bacteroidales bacterium]
MFIKYHHFISDNYAEIPCGIVVLRLLNDSSEAEIIFASKLARQFQTIEDSDLAQKKFRVNELPLCNQTIEAIEKATSEEKGMAYDAINNAEILVYKHGKDLVFIHLYYGEKTKNPTHKQFLTRPGKVVLMFNSDYNLMAISPYEDIKSLIKKPDLLNKKPEDIFSLDIGLRIMGALLKSRENKVEETFEVKIQKDEKPINIRVAYSEKNDERYYFVLLNFFPENSAKNLVKFSMNDTYRVLLDEMPNIVIIHQNGKIVYANKEASRMSGKSNLELVGLNILEQIPEKHHKKVLHNMMMRYNGMTANDYEIEMYGTNNTIRNAMIRTSNVMYNDNPATMAIIHDITHIRKMEEALHESKKKIETIIDSISSGVLIIDSETHIILKANKQACRMIGTDEDKIVNRVCHNFVCPNEKNCCPIEKKDTFFDNSEKTLKDIHGNCIPILKTVKYFSYEGKDCYLESFVDISELKEKENQIKLKEQMLSAIAILSDELLKNPDYFDALAKKMHLLGESTQVDRVYVFENDHVKDGEAESCSQKLEWNSGTKEPQINNPELQNVSFEAINIFMEPLRNNVAFEAIVDKLPDSYTKEVLQAQDILSILVLPLCVDGEFWGFVGFDECKHERKWSEMEKSLLSTFAGTLSAAIERKELEKSLKNLIDEAQSANKAKSEFLANMSHEIRTPLNAVIGFTDLLLKTELNNTQEEYMKAVNHSANLLLELINDILDYSKIEAGKLELYEEKVNLLSITEQITEIVKYKTFSKKLEFLLNIPTELPVWVKADGMRLRQILLNLLWNALKYTEEGEIELTILYKPCDINQCGLFHFSIRDTGIGIPNDKQKLIMEAFAQADSSTTRKYGGTGLGLPITISLLDKMGSKLNLESEPGKGSKFFFEVEFPIIDKDAINLSAISEIKNVLILDDNQHNLDIIGNMLDHMVIDSVAIQNTEDFAKTDIPEFDGFIIDYMMPSLNGLEVIDQIRKSGNAKDNALFILLHSSADDSEIHEKARTHGVQHVLSKPLTSIQLQRIILNHGKKEKKESTIKKKKEKTISSKISALIVEDNPANMVLAVTLLKASAPNAIIHKALNGREAIEQYTKTRPDLVFMDIQMPEMNGYDATLAIRKLEKENGWDSVPVVALTAGAVNGSREKALENGFSDFLTKPLLQKNIEDCLDIWLDNKHTDMTNPTEHFNKEQLMQNIMNNVELYHELIDISRDSLPDIFGQMRNAWEVRDMTKLKETSHNLKGQAMSLSCNKLQEACKEIELKAINKEQEGLGNLIETVESEIDLLLNEFFAE